VPEAVSAEMAKQGWDRPIPVQFASFVTNLVTRGDLGQSFVRPGRSVSADLRRRVPATIELSLAALVLAIPLGIALGVAAAVWRNGPADWLCTGVSLGGVSVPVFFLGILLVTIFSDMPTGRQLPSDLPPESDFESVTGFVIPELILRGRFDLLGEALRHIALPALALSTIPLATIARITRSSMLEVLSADYVRTARAKGNSWWRVVWSHAFPNAAVPVANIAGFQVGMLLTGAVLTESVFSWPGLGTYLVDAVKDVDYAVVQGGSLVVAVLFTGTNLFVDLLHTWLDPRIRLA
jgi:peptide/nickel transport system permease protein